MVNSFSIKNIFSEQELSYIKTNFGFRKWSIEELESAFQKAFHDYILVSLTELGEGIEENKKLYSEANFYLQKASKLLLGMPHPAGNMPNRINRMSNTLNKLIEGNMDISAERATRFTEKNLARNFRAIWTENTSTSFHTGSDGQGKSPRDFILYCFAAAAKHYPELEWFKQVDERIADLLIKSIKR